MTKREIEPDATLEWGGFTLKEFESFVREHEENTDLIKNGIAEFAKSIIRKLRFGTDPLPMREIAERIGVGPSYLSAIYGGRNDVSVCMFHALVDLYRETR